MRVGIGASVLVVGLCGCSALIALDHYRQCDGSDECARVVDSGRDESVVDAGAMLCEASADCAPQRPLCSRGACAAIKELSHGASADHACVVLSDGAVWCWGNDLAGQIDALPNTHHTLPTPAPLDPSVKAAHVFTGFTATCVLTADGKIYCWGNSASGGGTGAANAVLLPQAKWLSVGAYDVCALLANGEVACWGDNPGGEYGCMPSDAGCPSGEVKRGLANPWPLVTVESNKGVEEVAVGGYSICTRGSGGGFVSCWGNGTWGALGNGITSGPTCCDYSAASQVGNAPVNDSLPSMQGTEFYMCQQDNNRKWWCWGDNESCVLYGHPCPNGQGNPVATPVIIDIKQDIVQLAAGWRHMCAVVASGTDVACWGQNDHGQVGTGLNVPNLVTTATHVKGLDSTTQITDIAAHRHFTCVLKGQSVYCWGQTDHAQCGRLDIDALVPNQVAWP